MTVYFAFSFVILLGLLAWQIFYGLPTDYQLCLSRGTERAIPKCSACVSCGSSWWIFWDMFRFIILLYKPSSFQLQLYYRVTFASRIFSISISLVHIMFPKCIRVLFCCFCKHCCIVKRCSTSPESAKSSCRFFAVKWGGGLICLCDRLVSSSQLNSHSSPWTTEFNYISQLQAENVIFLEPSPAFWATITLIFGVLRSCLEKPVVAVCSHKV